jgi:hypothetical protein
MNESELKENLAEKIKNELEKKYPGKYEVNYDENLIYRVIITKKRSNSNAKLQYEPNDPQKPSRGDYAFQTDILISEKSSGLPLVVIEVKTKEPTTHDILTYSTKAVKHKEVYPYLRYGILIVNETSVPRRFFVHNLGFDFAIVLKDLSDEAGFKKLVEIIEGQIKNSEELIKVFNDEKSSIESYYTSLKIEFRKNSLYSKS